MSCDKCGESRYWDPSDGCMICNRKRAWRSIAPGTRYKVNCECGIDKGLTMTVRNRQPMLLCNKCNTAALLDAGSGPHGDYEPCTHCDRLSCDGYCDKAIAANVGTRPPVGRLGPMVVSHGLRSHLGSCNFCDDQSNLKVYEVSGGQLLVRFCANCLKRLKEQTK